MRLFIRRLADLTATLPAERRVLARRGWAGENRGLFAHPAIYSDTDTTRELIAAYYATIEFFRTLLEGDDDTEAQQSS